MRGHFFKTTKKRGRWVKYEVGSWLQ
jgi:hypothetical protein